MQGKRNRFLLLLFAALWFFGAAPSLRADTCPEQTDFSSLNNLLVDSLQAATRDKRVLKAMRETQRHLFLPPALCSHAYENRPLPIGMSQTISQPAVVALMTSALELAGSERVLEIGTGSGYQAAILSRLAKEVVSVEIVPALAAQAKKLLRNEGYANVDVRLGDGYKGWPEKAPYNAIIVTAAPPGIPHALIDQLAEGGRMVVPVGQETQELILIQRIDGKISKRSLGAVRFVPMVPLVAPQSRSVLRED